MLMDENGMTVQVWAFRHSVPTVPPTHTLHRDEDGRKVSLRDESDYGIAIETARESAKGRPEGQTGALGAFFSDSCCCPLGFSGVYLYDCVFIRDVYDALMAVSNRRLNIRVLYSRFLFFSFLKSTFILTFH
ncbi:hypothetical protein F5888DRAFT_430708 [Russula emetica]|nr:hypothetical protein F5888DRAFT_430708 [Russula emetica]